MMARKPVNTIKLGIFVLAGLAFLVLMLYVIGKKRHLFGSTFLLRTHFPHAGGLTKGNAVRYSGIDAGTVRSVEVLNDTTIEVTMDLKESMRPFIRKNCTARIGSDGLMGNRLINLQPDRTASPLVAAGDVLRGTTPVGTDELLEVLNGTGKDLAVVVAELKSTTRRVNESKAIWRYFEDESMANDLRSTLQRLRAATGHLNDMAAGMQALSSDLRSGKGTIGNLLTDPTIAESLTRSTTRLEGILQRSDSLFQEANGLARTLHDQLQNGKGVLPAVMTDTQLTQRLDNTLANLENGTKAFDEAMIALQHNFLLRGYFRKQEARKKKEAAVTQR